MKREGYYGLLLAALALLLLYLLNKAGLLHNNSFATSANPVTTAVVSATVGGIPVGSSVTMYPTGGTPNGDFGGETSSPVKLAPVSDIFTPISSIRLLASNDF